MKKFFIILTGIYLLFLALIGILIVILSFMNFNSNIVLSTNERIQVAIVWIPLSGWLSATGIGLFLKKNWARYSIMVMSGLAIFMGLIGCLGFCFMSFPEISAEGTPVQLIRLIILVPLFLFLIILPSIYLIFFNKRSVKEIFEAASSLKRPLGISVLAILSLFNVINMISLTLFPTIPIFPFFGFLISGTAITIHNLILAMVNFYIAYGFWKLKQPAWITAIVLGCMNILSGVFNFFLINVDDYCRLLFPNGAEPYFISAWTKYGFLFGSVISTVVLIYLISRRLAFLKDKPNTSSEVSMER